MKTMPMSTNTMNMITMMIMTIMIMIMMIMTTMTTMTMTMLSLQVTGRNIWLLVLIDSEERMQSKPVVFYLFMTYAIIEIFRWMPHSQTN